jgi:hypothetical protein
MVVYSAAPAGTEPSIAAAIAAPARKLIFITIAPLVCALFNP